MKNHWRPSDREWSEKQIGDIGFVGVIELWRLLPCENCRKINMISKIATSQKSLIGDKILMCSCCKKTWSVQRRRGRYPATCSDTCRTEYRSGQRQQQRERWRSHTRLTIGGPRKRHVEVSENAAKTLRRRAASTRTALEELRDHQQRTTAAPKHRIEQVFVHLAPLLDQVDRTMGRTSLR